MGLAIPDAAWRLVEQQREELPFCVSQLELARQQERQCRLSGCGGGVQRSCAVRTGGWESIGRTKQESRPTPVGLITTSEYQTESDSLVGCKVEQLSDSSYWKEVNDIYSSPK